MRCRVPFDNRLGAVNDIPLLREHLPVLELRTHHFEGCASATHANALRVAMEERFLEHCIQRALCERGRILPDDPLGVVDAYWSSGCLVYTFPAR